MSTRNRRNLILDCALALLAERGAQAVRLADVAEAAGVSRQAVYKHFGSRSKLLAAAMERANETSGLHELAAPVREAASAEEELAAFVRLQAVHNPRIHAIGRAVDEARRGDEAAAEAWALPLRERRAACRRIVGRLGEEGVLAPGWSEETAADVLHVLTSLRTWEELVVDCGFSAERYADAVLSLTRSAFVA